MKIETLPTIYGRLAQHPISSRWIAASLRFDLGSRGTALSRFWICREAARRRARLLVENYWPEIEALARVLMERKQLDASEAGEVLRGSILRRRGMLMSY